MEHMEHMEVATSLLLKSAELEPGQHRRHALQQAVQLPLQMFLEMNKIVKNAVRLAQLLVLKLTENGQHTVAVFKVNVLGHALGLQYKQILQPVAQQLPQKLMELTMNTLRVARLDVRWELKPILSGVRGERVG